MPTVTDRSNVTEHLSDRQQCFADCCAMQTPITLISPHNGAVSKGFFHRIDGTSLTVRLIDGQLHDLAEKSCCATFLYESRRWTFLSFVLGVSDGIHRQLVLEVTQQVLAEKRQRAIRFAVPTATRFCSSLRFDDLEFKGRVININTRGALVEFDELVDVKLETPVQLELYNGNESVLVPACPVRRERSRLGFAFEGETGDEWKISLKTMLETKLGLNC